MWAHESQVSSSVPLPSGLSLLGCLAEFLPHQQLLGWEFPIVLITTIHYSPFINHLSQDIIQMPLLLLLPASLHLCKANARKGIHQGNTRKLSVPRCGQFKLKDRQM